MNRRSGPLVICVLVALASGWAVSATEVDSGSDPPVIEIRARLLTNSGTGPTREAASAWKRTEVGARAELHLFAGGFEFNGTPYCNHGSGDLRVDPEGEMVAGRHLRWRLDAELVGAAPDSMAVELAWSRTDLQGHTELSRETEKLSLTLPHGGRRVLDLASFPVESDCSGRRYVLELEVRYLGAPRYLGQLLEYDIWFLRTTKNRVEELGHHTLRAVPGEEVDFRFLPVDSKTVLGWTVEKSEEVALYADCGGTVRAWILDDDRVSALVDTSFGLQRRHADGEPLVISTGHGRKRVDARLGETTEIRFPALSGHLSMPSEQLRLAEPRPRGLTVEGDQVVLRFEEFYEGIDYSIRVTVRDRG